MAIRQVTACCGAYFDPQAATLNADKALEPLVNTMRRFEIGFILSDCLPVNETLQSFFKKVCDGLYLAHSQFPSYGPWEPKGPFQTMMADEEMVPISGYDLSNYIYLGTIGKIKFINRFAHGPYKGIIPKFLKLVEKSKNQHLTCILSDKQHDLWHDMVTKSGFEVVDRCVNPKTNHQLTFYYRKPD